VDDKMVDAYLARIGAERPLAANLEALQYLELRHLLTVPWENLALFLDEPFLLDEEFILDKIVTRRRGGGCIELNSAFGALLGALGFQVWLVPARLFYEGGIGVPYDHLCLRVEAPEPYLVDVGIAGFSRRPLRLDSTDEQADVVGKFQVLPAPYGDVDVHENGQPRYRVELRPRQLADFKVSLWWHLTCSASRVHSENYPFVWLPTEDGQIMLHHRNLARQVHEDWVGKTYADDRETLAGYQEHFGLALDRVPDQARLKPWTESL
jgi:N-hydroxyarylamine O-acetyltransferase